MGLLKRGRAVKNLSSRLWNCDAVHLQLRRLSWPREAAEVYMRRGEDQGESMSLFSEQDQHLGLDFLSTRLSTCMAHGADQVLLVHYMVLAPVDGWRRKIFSHGLRRCWFQQ